MKTITIKQWSTPLVVNKGTILDAALKSGIPFPHGCRTGKCGQCKTLVTNGEVNPGNYFKEALSDEERSEGYVLACQACPTTDLEIAWQGEIDPADVFPVAKLKASVIGYDQLSEDVTRVRLVTREPFGFAAGQYSRLQFGKLPARSYSMASRPGEALLEFHINHVPDGLVSSYVADKLSIGDKVIVEGPFGSSHLRQNESGPLIAVAGSTGLAPLLSIIRQALAVDPEQAVHLYFGVREEKDIYARDELIALRTCGAKNLTIHTVLSAVESTDLGSVRIGFLHEALAQDFTDLSSARLYTAGPPPMVEAVLTVALQRGMDVDRIHTDPFVSSDEGGDSAIRRLVRSFSDVFSRKPLATAA